MSEQERPPEPTDLLQWIYEKAAGDTFNLVLTDDFVFEYEYEDYKKIHLGDLLDSLYDADLIASRSNRGTLVQLTDQGVAEAQKLSK